MKTKFISLFLVIVLTLAILAGCVQSTKTTAKDPEPSNEKNETVSTKDAPSGIEMSDVPNMTAPGVLPIVIDPVEISVAFVPNISVTDYTDNEFTKWIKEKTGIDIVFEFLPAENAAQKVELMVASNQELADIVNVKGLSNSSKNDFYESGIILPLDDYMDKYCYYWNIMVDKWVNEKEAVNMDTYTRSYDGARILYPTLYTETSAFFNPTYTIYMNRYWLEELGMKPPTNTDELFDVLVAFRDKDPNKNGKKDEVPLLGGVDVLINSFIYYSPFDNTVLNVENDIISTPVITDEYREALRYLNKLAKEGLLSPLTFTADEQQKKSMLALDGTDVKPYVGAFSGHPTLLFDTNSEIRNYYKAVLDIKGPAGKSHVMYTPTGLDFRTFITKYCSTPEIAVRLLDFMSEEETMIRSRWGVKGQDWVYAEPGEECSYAFIGYEALYTVINNPYSSSNNLIWKNDYITCLPSKLHDSRSSTPYQDPAREESQKHFIEVLSKKWGKEPEQVIGKILYTPEEERAISEIKTTLYSYIIECQTRFIMGEMSIENDWDSYINTLKSIGLDLFIETTQKAWNRMYNVD